MQAARWSRRSRRSSPRGSALPSRPRLEVLEARTLPSLFAPGVTLPTGVKPLAVAVADVNGDGLADLVTANQGSNTVSVLLGNDNGTFAAAQNFAVGTHPAAVAVADVNNNGRPDLIVANSGSNTVSILLGNGNGTFKAAQNFATGGKPVAVAVADVNHDG